MFGCRGRCNTRCPAETHLKPKYREILSAHVLILNFPIVFTFCTAWQWYCHVLYKISERTDKQKRVLWTNEILPDLSLRSQIAKFMGPTWGPPGSCRPQMGPMLAPWILLSGMRFRCMSYIKKNGHLCHHRLYQRRSPHMLFNLMVTVSTWHVFAHTLWTKSKSHQISRTWN